MARPVGKKEIEITPDAKAAMLKELNNLVAQDVWRTSDVREWSAVAKEARDNSKTVHFGYIFGLGKQKLYTRGTGFLFLDIFETPDLKKLIYKGSAKI